MTDHNRYFLKTGDEATWRGVTRREWIRAERNAGFRPKMDLDDPRYDDTLATGGFSTSAGGGIEGRVIDMRHYKPEDYAFDPSFPKLTETSCV